MEKLFDFIGWLLHPILNLFYSWSRVVKQNKSDYKEYNEDVTADIYWVKDDDSKLIIIHPILTGDNLVARFIANYFAIVHRVNCMVVHRGAYPFDGKDPEEFQRKMDAYVYNFHIAETIGSQMNIWSKKTIVASIGTSMGGIVNATMAGMDKYHSYACLIAGGPIPDVMRNSSLKLFKEWTKKQMKDHSYIDKDELFDDYMTNVHTDPIIYAKDANHKNVLLLNAMFDRIVPTRNQRKLRDSFLRRPITLWFPVGHVLMILFIWMIMPILSWWVIRTWRRNR